MNSSARNHLILYPSKAKTLFLLVLSIAFVITGVVITTSGENAGWIVTGFFGLCIPLVLLRLVPGKFHLKLTDDRFEVKTLFKLESFQWSDVEQFKVSNIGRDTKVVFNFSDEFTKNKLNRSVSKLITGTEGVMPDTYGKTPSELADLLNEWKSRK